MYIQRMLAIVPRIAKLERMSFVSPKYQHDSLGTRRLIELRVG